MNPLQPVSSAEEQQVKAELNDRSFRQFDPSKEANKRKGVILNSFNDISLRSQYSPGRTVLNEWEISVKDYRFESWTEFKENEYFD